MARVREFTLPIEDAVLRGEWQEGDGLPLVLVHGFGGSRRDWDAVVAALPPTQAVVAYDQRGFGASVGEAGRAFSHADDLIALLDALEVERADVCGVSLGGATVLSAALTAPARVRRVVLVSPMLAGWSWSADWVALWKEIGRAARSGDMALARDLWFSHPLFATTRASGKGEYLRQAIDAFAGEQWVRDDQRAELPMVERLHALTAPTLLLTGRHDLPDFRLMADLIEATVPDIQRIDNPDAGHLLTLETPAAIAAAMTRFLAGH